MSTASWKRWERIYFTGFNAAFARPCYFIPPKSESFINKDSSRRRLPGFPAVPLFEGQLPRHGNSAGRGISECHDDVLLLGTDASLIAGHVSPVLVELACDIAAPAVSAGDSKETVVA